MPDGNKSIFTNLIHFPYFLPTACEIGAFLNVAQNFGAGHFEGKDECDEGFLKMESKNLQLAELKMVLTSKNKLSSPLASTSILHKLIR